MKIYFLPAFCLILLSLSACKKAAMNDPFVQKGTMGSILWPVQNGIHPEEDLRDDYQVTTKSISVDIGKVQIHSGMWETLQDLIENRYYDKAELTEIRLSNLVLIPRSIQESTWTTFLKDLKFVFTPDDGKAPTILANFSHFGPITAQTSFGFNMNIIEQNLVDLLFEQSGRFSLEFSFIDLPDDKISLIETQFHFTGKYQLTTY